MLVKLVTYGQHHGMAHLVTFALLQRKQRSTRFGALAGSEDRAQDRGALPRNACAPTARVCHGGVGDVGCRPPPAPWSGAEGSNCDMPIEPFTSLAACRLSPAPNTQHIMQDPTHHELPHLEFLSQYP